MQLTTESGTAIRLGKEIGRGGEATVFEVQGIGGVVAKIYQRAPQKSLSKKLRDMVAIGRGSSELGRLAAWPTDLLVESASQDLKGFLMRRVDGHFPVHELYTPKSRHERFPTASWKFLVHAAMNVCEAFRLIHENGIVIGDVNHSNLLISPRATAFLIDCDSMGVNRGECIHPCSGVGIRDFLPPELQVNFCGSQRTTNHDLFGLAVILFQLLFGGRHPFTGMLRASTKGEVPECGEAIREGDFAYSRIRIGRLQPKAGWPGLDIVGEKCATLFEKAFLNVPGCKRPAAEEWGGALRLLLQDVKVCSRSRDHVYHRPIGSCPWCKLLVAGGYDLFAGSARQFDSWSPSRSRLPDLLREYINVLQEYQKCIDLSHQPAYTCSPRPLGFTLVSEPVSPGPRPEPAAFAIPTGDMPIYRPPDLPALVLLRRPDPPDPPELPRLMSNTSLKRRRSLTEEIWSWICRKSPGDSAPTVASASLGEIEGVDYQLACGKYELRVAAWRIEATRVDQENNRRMVVHKHEVERINQEAKQAFQAELEAWREQVRQVELRVTRSFQTAVMNWQEKMNDFTKRKEQWKVYVSSYNLERKNRSDALSIAIAECARAKSELINGIDKSQKNLYDVLRRNPADLEREVQELITEYRRQCHQKMSSGGGLEQHLVTVPLSSGINTIGSGVLYYSLLQFGIRTAADCGDFNRLTRVSGIGPRKAAAIMQWRKVVINEWQRQQASKPSLSIVEINRRFGKQAEQLELTVDSLTACIRDELANSRLSDLKAHYHNCLRIRSQCEADMLPCL